MQYYYLDKTEKKGPYTKEMLRDLNLSPATIVFTEGMENWEAIKNIPELVNYLFKSEYQSSEDSVNIPNTTNSTNTNFENVKSQKNKPKINISTRVFLCILYTGCIGLAYVLTLLHKQKNLDEINKIIDEILKNKTVISDYKYNGCNGKLYDITHSLIDKQRNNINKEIIKVEVAKTEKRILASKPNFWKGDLFNFDNIEKKWTLFKDLVQYYECEKFSGFNVLKLEKNVNTFSLTEQWSGDMAYKVPENKHISFSFGDYNMPTDRPDVNECYEEGAKYLTIENKDKSYEANSYNKISSFIDLKNTFFEISQCFPKYKRLSGKIDVDYGYGKGISNNDESKITDATSVNDASIYTNQWIVWYKSMTNTYSIEESKGALIKYFAIYSIIILVITSLIFFGFKYRQSIVLK